MSESSRIQNTKVIGKLNKVPIETSNPKISIIIPAYNVTAYISDSIDSVIAQTCKNYEIIVVNDGSPDTDELERVLTPYFSRIIYIKQENQGAPAARNAALKIARGEFVAFLDPDDIWLPEFLELQLSFLEKNDLDVVWADAYLFGEIISVGRTFMQTCPSEGKVTFESLLEQKCNVIISGTLAKKKAIIDLGGFDNNIRFSGDFDLWLRMAYSGARFGYQRRILLKYRIRLGSLSGDSIHRVKKEINIYQKIAEKLDLKPNHTIIIEGLLKKLQASLHVERGKAFLVSENFGGASYEFRKANKYFHSNKLRAVLIMLSFMPRILLRIFKLRRASDLPFISKVGC
jgi:glycosyltransferase involved in cell wall biosynthesis